MSRAMQRELLCSPDRWQPTTADERGRWEPFAIDGGFIGDEPVPVVYSEEIAECLREWAEEEGL